MKSQEVVKLRGIIPAMVTPFRAEDEELDEEALRREARYHVDCGVTGICVCGSSGEGASVTVEEAGRAYRAVVAEAKGQVPIIAGVIADCTREAVSFGLAAREAGAVAVQVTPVHYIVPSEDGLVEYYRVIGERVGLPIIIYDVVPRVYISPALMLRLVEIPQVCGIKQSGGDIHKLAELLRLLGDSIPVFSALDDVLYASFTLGAAGSISAITSVLPGPCVQLWNATKAGKREEALALHNRMLGVWRAIEGKELRQRVQMQSRMKTAIKLQGRPVGIARSPQLPLRPEEVEPIRQALAEAGFLKVPVS